MKFTVDLISDLHIETWDNFDWTGQATSPYCIVAGDVCRDRELLVDVLTHLGECYNAVFYIDGNDEHRNYLHDLGGSYRDLKDRLSEVKNVVYMHDNVVIINGIAIVATNGWWTYDFDSEIDKVQTIMWTKERYGIPFGSATIIHDVANNDTRYTLNAISKLQTHPDVQKIILVSHTVPAPWIIEHDLDLIGNYRFNTMGNSEMQRVLSEDSENKIEVWLFGHYHKPVDQDFSGIRFTNNCRGRGDTDFKQVVYRPKQIQINY